jgi:hypothetical protein
VIEQKIIRHWQRRVDSINAEMHSLNQERAELINKIYFARQENDNEKEM